MGLVVVPEVKDEPISGARIVLFCLRAKTLPFQPSPKESIIVTVNTILLASGLGENPKSTCISVTNCLIPQSLMGFLLIYPYP